MQHVQRRIAERFVWVLAILVAAAGLVAAQTIALDVTTAGANPCEKGQAGANNPNCQDGEFTPPEDDEADEDEGEGGGAPALPASCSELVDALADGGAPAELTDGLQQLCDAAEGGDGEPGDEEPGDGEPGDEDEDAGEGGNALQAGCDDLVDAVADATADELRELGAVCDGLGMLPLDEAPLPLGLR